VNTPRLTAGCPRDSATIAVSVEPGSSACHDCLVQGSAVSTRRRLGAAAIVLLGFLTAVSVAKAAPTASLVKDINFGAATSNPADLTDLKGTLYFAATDPQHGRELGSRMAPPPGQDS
jgi:hypothetical protein